MDTFERSTSPPGDSRDRRYERIPEMKIDEARFDLPPLDSSRARRRYVICSTQRSGSFLLCRQMINAGLGVPQEYFNILHVAALTRRWQISTESKKIFLLRLYEKRTTSNGVWGTKLQWPQFMRFRSDLECELWGDSRTIFLYRANLDAQAVSLHTSFVTGIWGFDMMPTTKPSRTVTLGDIDHVLHCRQLIENENELWRRFFDERSIEPLVICYEDLVRDQPRFVTEIAGWMGIDSCDYRVPPAEERDAGLAPEIEGVRASLLERLRR